MMFKDGYIREGGVFLLNRFASQPKDPKNTALKICFFNLLARNSLSVKAGMDNRRNSASARFSLLLKRNKKDSTVVKRWSFKGHIIIFLVLLFNGVFAAVFAESLAQRGKAANHYQEKNLQEPAQHLGSFSLTGINQRGAKSWDISGKSADINSSVIVLDDIVSNFYGENENTLLTADRGDFNRRLGQLYLEKDVVVTTSSGTKMTTHTLVWDKETELVSTKDMVNIERQDMIITGQGAKARLDLKEMDLEKDVQVQIKTQAPNSPENLNTNITIINCDGPLQIDYQNNIATFNNNVRVESPDGIMEANIMEVYFLTKDKEVAAKSADKLKDSFERGRIEKIVCRGNVKISQDKNISYSQEAVYSASDRKITLSGRPKLVVYSTEDISR